MDSNEVRSRKKLRLKEYDYAQPGAYFVTTCTHERKCMLSSIQCGMVYHSNLGRIVEHCWIQMPDYFPQVELSDFVVMPNHLHGILLIKPFCPWPFKPANGSSPSFRKPGPRAGSVSAIMAQFKAAVTRASRIEKQQSQLQIWQASFYERVVRDEEDLLRTRNYIQQNPLKWELDKFHPAMSSSNLWVVPTKRSSN